MDSSTVRRLLRRVHPIALLSGVLLVALIIIPFLVMAFCIRRILKLRDK